MGKESLTSLFKTEIQTTAPVNPSVPNKELNLTNKSDFKLTDWSRKERGRSPSE